MAVDGVIYFPGSGSVLYAIDAVSGKPLWKHDPKVAENIDPSLLRFVFRANRGVAYSNNKILLGTNDGRHWCQVESCCYCKQRRGSP